MSGSDQNPYMDEVRDRWGDTDAYRESSHRIKKYSKDDWERIKGQKQAIDRGLAQAMADGDPAEGERAMGLAEHARLHIDRWYYPCSHAMHVGLAEMYLTDARFRAHYDDQAEGLAEYVAGAIRANAARQS